MGESGTVTMDCCGESEESIVDGMWVIDVRVGSSGWAPWRHVGSVLWVGFRRFRGDWPSSYILRKVLRHFQDRPHFAKSLHQLHSLSTLLGIGDV